MREVAKRRAARAALARRIGDVRDRRDEIVFELFQAGERRFEIGLEKLRPVDASCFSAEAPASADLASAWSIPLRPSASVCRMSGASCAPVATPAVMARKTSRIASRSKRRLRQRSERQIMDAAADVHALAHKLFSGLLETLFDRSC